jgi:hypothetical protein
MNTNEIPVGSRQANTKTKKKAKLFQKVFVVEMREVHIQGYRVYGCKTVAEAIEKANAGEGELNDAHFEYSHTLPIEASHVSIEMEEVK